MSDHSPLALSQIAGAARALVEAERYEPADRVTLDAYCRKLVSGCASGQRDALRTQVATLSGAEATTGSSVRAKTTADSAAPGSLQDLMKQRARLELSVQTESTRARELESKLTDEQSNRKEAEQNLVLQQRKLKELEQERGKLLEEVSRLESQVRLQINETEQAKLQYEKLKSARQALGEQATEQAERMNALQTENERLKAELESARQERDARLTDAHEQVAQAESQTDVAAFQVLWAQLVKEFPEVFPETHVANRATFENVTTAFLEFVSIFVRMEAHVNTMLRDLRRVSDKADKLNHFYIMFQKQPSLTATMLEFLTTGRKKGNFVNMLRAIQAWARAFGSGMYKTVVVSPGLIQEELNPKDWPVKGSFTQSEDAALGKYYKETAFRQIPEKLGTTFRKYAGDMAYEDYNALMKKSR